MAAGKSKCFGTTPATNFLLIKWSSGSAGGGGFRSYIAGSHFSRLPLMYQLELVQDMTSVDHLPGFYSATDIWRHIAPEDSSKRKISLEIQRGNTGSVLGTIEHQCDLNELFWLSYTVYPSDKRQLNACHQKEACTVTRKLAEFDTADASSIPVRLTLFIETDHHRWSLVLYD